MRAFLRELQRRNVFRVGVVYLASAWLVLQVVNNVAPPLRLPDWVASFTTVLLGIGLPVTLVLAWLFELTPDGIKRATDVDPASGVAAHTARKLDRILIGVLAVLVAVLVVDRVLLTRPAGTAAKKVEAAAGEPSIAVLPFADMSPNHDQEYFSDGLTEELLNKLVGFGGLRVIGRTSSFAFKGKNDNLRTIGETLGVSHILEGSVRKSGDQLRITAQLVNPADGSHLWSKTYDRGVSEVFAIQDDISNRVAEALAVTLGVPREGSTKNIQAYEEYLVGRASGSRVTAESAAAGLAHLSRAVELDPNFSDAWASLGVGYQIAAQTGFVPVEESASKIAAIADRLQTLAPNSYAAGFMQSRVLLSRGDLAGAEQALRRARASQDASAGSADAELGRLLMRIGRAREALGYLERARDAEPLDTNASLFLAEGYGNAGDLKAALAEYDRGLKFAPQHPLFVGSAVLAALATGDAAEIERRAAIAARVEPTAGALNGDFARFVSDNAGLRTAVANAWSNASNQAGLRGLAVAHWAAYAGDTKLALEALHLQPSLIVTYAIWRPVMASVRADPGFKDLVRDRGLVDYWRKSGNWGDFCRPLNADDFECR